MENLIKIILVFWFVVISNLFASTIQVSSIQQFNSAITKAKAGDSIIVADGVYTLTKPIEISCIGNENHPIIISAQNIGKSEIEGSGGIILDSPAAFIVIRGFNFTHATGTSEIKVDATHCKITRNIYECVRMALEINLT